MLERGDSPVVAVRTPPLRWLGGIYVLVAVGLTLIYGVLHIINFAHGSLLMLAMYAVFWLWRLVGVAPYVALPLVTAALPATPSNPSRPNAP